MKIFPIQSECSSRNEAGYTMVEMVVSIAIMTLMVGIVAGTYSLGRNFDTMKAETQRLASVMRSARARAFNGTLLTTTVCSNSKTTACTVDGNCVSPGTCTAIGSVYPAGGYALHLDNNSKACTGDPHLFCATDADCTIQNQGSCVVSPNKSSYILFADFDGGADYDGANEKIEQYDVANNFNFKFPSSGTYADVFFKSASMLVFENGIQLLASSYTIDVNYKTPCASVVQNKKGSVQLDLIYQKVNDSLVSC
ncbi:MAG: hypothetical protein A3B30_03900 [Candidatus Komeilibacteria bacterium RIFCSPLOWO2_01_FULL_52_15]|uniref:Prepilin-type N-terminal cleavage/methylation domain-containing protein n=2 Tax=Candidatus Komeiliibacteriota TaxID=1817908 RepID=A0A1G2BQC2_9BACT|nr:MAG: hypothetical protein A2677_03010 [Candidatus Komeilibacteria bacterium RIFCSPHIGHO2_01_FULL_52_14]OGY91308.1 MAG: hypothetical protein A3B30_03900 [Candidatus Komeilibacteria bacterium RIFCSPLOWO2_01_FULL_52_15]